MSRTTNKFAREARQRAVRMVLDHEADHPSLGGDGFHRREDRVLGAHTERMGKERGGRQRQARWCVYRDGGSAEDSERENRRLRQANEILRKASAYLAQAKLKALIPTGVALPNRGDTEECSRARIRDAPPENYPPYSARSLYAFDTLSIPRWDLTLSDPA